MGYITSRVARLKRNLLRIQDALTALNASFIDASESGVESYAFDSGEGSQRTTRRKLSEIRAQIRNLEAEEESIINELYGMGLVNVRLRRKTPC